MLLRIIVLLFNKPSDSPEVKSKPGPVYQINIRDEDLSWTSLYWLSHQWIVSYRWSGVKFCTGKNDERSISISFIKWLCKYGWFLTGAGEKVAKQLICMIKWHHLHSCFPFAINLLGTQLGKRAWLVPSLLEIKMMPVSVEIGSAFMVGFRAPEKSGVLLTE